MPLLCRSVPNFIYADFFLKFAASFPGTAPLGDLGSDPDTRARRPVLGSGYTLVASDGMMTRWVPESMGSSVYRKETNHPSEHVKLTQIDASTVDEDRADGTTWRYGLSAEGIFTLSRVSERHGKSLTILRQLGYLKRIENSEGYWIEISRPIFETPPPVVSFPNYRITGMTDSAGYDVAFTYDGLGKLRSWKDEDDHVWLFDYGQVTGKLAAITNPKGETVLVATYDSSNRINSLGLGSGVTTIDYNTNLNETEVTDPVGHKTVYHYNANGITTSVETADGATTAITLDAANNVSTFVDAAGNTSSFVWDVNHRLISYTAPSSAEEPLTWSYAYDSSGHLLEMANPKGTRTHFVYGSHSDVISKWIDTDDDGFSERSWSATYDGAGNLETLTNPRGYTTSYAYNSQDLLTSITLPTSTSPTTRLEYDTGGRLTRISRPRYSTISANWDIAYNGCNRPVSITLTTGETTSFTYDAAGRLSGVVDPLLHTRTLSYDSSSRLVSAIDPLGKNTKFQYDDADNLISMTDATSHEWLYAYDEMNRMWYQTDPLGSSPSASIRFAENFRRPLSQRHWGSGFLGHQVRRPWQSGRAM